MATAFETFIDDLLQRRFEGKKNRLAAAIGITPSALGRQVREGSLGLEPLLRLSKVVGIPTRKVLEVAGKREWADLIESIYGAPATPLSEIDRELIALPLEVKRAALAMTGRQHAPLERTSVRGRGASSR